LTAPATAKQTIHTCCPACGKGHDADPEFGPYCNLRCLTLALQGRIASDPAERMPALAK